MEKEITYEDLERVNSTIRTTDIKGKEYAEVNQRIKAFRMLYPNGLIETEMISNENGICIMKAKVGYVSGAFEEKVRWLATGYAYEKENSTFINKTSYIENCETSAVGRALGMAGFGIDTSVASAEEVQNAINNQLEDITEEYAESYEITFGKHKGKTLKQIYEEAPDYLEWLMYNSKDETLQKCASLVSGKKLYTEEEQQEVLTLMTKMKDLLEQTNTDKDKFYSYYKVTSDGEMSLEQLKDAVEKLSKKVE